MPLFDIFNLKGVIGPPIDIGGGGGGGTGNANFFKHLVTAGEETANTITLAGVFPPLTVSLTIAVQRENGDVVNPGVNGITSITPTGSDIVIVFNVFTILEDDIVWAIEGASA